MAAFQLKHDDGEWLRGQWLDLAGGYTQDEGTAGLVFQSLHGLYSEPNRFYHNLSHVKSLLDLAQSFRNRFIQYDSVRFAIWFHDAIYDTGRTDNEERSAEFAVESLGKLCVPARTVDDVRAMILATKQHASGDGPPDLPSFLDLDLSILGAPEELYREYAKAIRQEYAWVPELLYKQGRTNLLREFLGKPKIYSTPDAYARFEQQARRNIEREVARLTTGGSNS